MGARRGRLSDAEFQAIVEKARERHNLSDIVGRHTDLKRRGRNEQVGLCCFHSERTPSLEVNDAKGTYHCHGCGKSGDAIRFLVEQEGMPFIDALRTLLGDEFPVVSDDERAKRKADDARAAAERISLGRSVWTKAVPARGTPAEIYAQSRGIIMPLPPTVRFVMTPRWRNLETGEVGRDYPAMACALQDVTGSVVGVQCVFLMDGGRRKFERLREDGTKAKAKLTFGQLVGSAFRLGPVSDHIITCEGPEDALTLAQRLTGKSVWASCGTANLWQMQFPEVVQSVCFAGDNGLPGRNAVATAFQSAIARGLVPSEAFPPPQFKDWNDELQGVVI